MDRSSWMKGMRPLSQLRSVSQVHFKEELRPALDYKFPTFYSSEKYPLTDLTREYSRSSSTSRLTTSSVGSARPVLSSRFSSDGNINTAPDGGLKAWSVVVGGFLNYFATFGMPLTFAETFDYRKNINTQVTLRLTQFIRHISNVLSG
jgi:hypothetical protein